MNILGYLRRVIKTDFDVNRNFCFEDPSVSVEFLGLMHQLGELWCLQSRNCRTGPAITTLKKKYKNFLEYLLNVMLKRLVLSNKIEVRHDISSTHLRRIHRTALHRIFLPNIGRETSLIVAPFWRDLVQKTPYQNFLSNLRKSVKQIANPFVYGDLKASFVRVKEATFDTRKGFACHFNDVRIPIEIRQDLRELSEVWRQECRLITQGKALGDQGNRVKRDLEKAICSRFDTIALWESIEKLLQQDEIKMLPNTVILEALEQIISGKLERQQLIEYVFNIITNNLSMTGYNSADFSQRLVSEYSKDLKGLVSDAVDQMPIVSPLLGALERGDCSLGGSQKLEIQFVDFKNDLSVPSPVTVATGSGEIRNVVLAPGIYRVLRSQSNLFQEGASSSSSSSEQVVDYENTSFVEISYGFEAQWTSFLLYKDTDPLELPVYVISVRKRLETVQQEVVVKDCRNNRINRLALGDLLKYEGIIIEEKIEPVIDDLAFSSQSISDVSQPSLDHRQFSTVSSSVPVSLPLEESLYNFTDLEGVPSAEQERLSYIAEVTSRIQEKPKSLMFTGCQILTQETLLPFLHRDLEELRLIDCPMISGLEKVFDVAPHLKTLFVESCKNLKSISNFTASTTSRPFGKCIEAYFLEQLSIKNCYNLKDISLVPFALKELVVCDNPKLQIIQLSLLTLPKTHQIQNNHQTIHASKDQWDERLWRMFYREHDDYEFVRLFRNDPTLKSFELDLKDISLSIAFALGKALARSRYLESAKFIVPASNPGVERAIRAGVGKNRFIPHRSFQFTLRSDESKSYESASSSSHGSSYHNFFNGRYFRPEYSSSFDPLYGNDFSGPPFRYNASLLRNPGADGNWGNSFGFSTPATSIPMSSLFSETDPMSSLLSGTDYQTGRFTSASIRNLFSDVVTRKPSSFLDTFKKYFLSDKEE